jgi:hypothetical protein
VRWFGRRPPLDSFASFLNAFALDTFATGILANQCYANVSIETLKH